MTTSAACVLGPEARRARVLPLLKRHGWNATSFQVLDPAFRYWFDGDDACVAYVDTGRAWVAAGAPLAPLERLAPVATRFGRAAAAAGRRHCFFATEERLRHRAPLDTLPIGEQPVWDPGQWGATLGKVRSLREQVRRARVKGVTVRRLEPPQLGPGRGLRARIEALLGRWLASRALPPLAFLAEAAPWSFADERRCFVAERAGQAVGFLSAVPVYARGGWSMQLLARDPSAPNGTTELLVDAAFRAAAADGSRWVTLGLAPLAGPVAGWLRAARRAGASLYDFDGLRSYRAKLRPAAWDPVFLSHPASQGPLTSLYDALSAFAGGGLLRFGWRTLIRAPGERPATFPPPARGATFPGPCRSDHE